jgi:hypothetical protein
MELVQNSLAMRIAALSVLFLALAAQAQEKTVSKCQVTDGGKAIDVWVTRTRDSEGGIAIKLIARGVGPKPQSLTIYTGGGADDGAGDDEVQRISAKPFDLPGGKKGVRVDYTFRIPDGKKNDEQTDTMLVGFGGGKTHKLIELRTRRYRDRSKICREGEEVSLTIEGNDLVAGTSQKTDPELGDDDLPIDKTCKAPRGVAKKKYPWKDEKFVDPDATDDESEGGGD